jgi:hypothetical protein
LYKLLSRVSQKEPALLLKKYIKGSFDVISQASELLLGSSLELLSSSLELLSSSELLDSPLELLECQLMEDEELSSLEEEPAFAITSFSLGNSKEWSEQDRKAATANPINIIAGMVRI